MCTLSVDHIEDVRPFEDTPQTSATISVPAALQEPLFGAQAAGVNAPEAKAHTYAVLDPGRVPGLIELLDAARLPHVSLMPFDEQEPYGDVGPWLVKLPPRHDFTRRLFKKGPPFLAFWGQRPGVFLRSSATLEQLAQHFQPLVKTENTQGKAIYFRFWEPEVALTYLNGIQGWPERLNRLFVTPFGDMVAFLVPDAEAHRVTRFSLEERVPPAPQHSFRLEPRDEAILAQAFAPRVVQALAAWLPDQVPAYAGLSETRQREAAAEALRLGRRYGFGFQEEVAQLLYMMTFLGASFDTDPLRRAFHGLLKTERADRYQVMRDTFPTVWAQSPVGAIRSDHVLQFLLSKCDEVASRPSGWEELSSNDVAALASGLEQLCAFQPEDIAAARADLAETCQRLGITSPCHQWVCYILRIMFGASFDRDPAQPWLAGILARPQRAETRIRDALRFSHRLLRRQVAGIRE